MSGPGSENLPHFGGLDHEVVAELLRRSFAGGGLTEQEQFVFGLRYGLVETEGGGVPTDDLRPLDVPQVAQRIYDYTGESLTEIDVARVLEQAEAKTSQYIWEAVNHAAWTYIERTRERG